MSNIIGERKVKIVLAMNRIDGPAPVHHISQKSGVEDAQELLHQLEKDGIICRASPISESMSNVPQYELTNKAKKLLQQLVATQLEQLIMQPRVIEVRV
jgi:ribosomal protein S19E (S16A)